MLTILLPFLVALVGLLMYALSQNAKVQHIGDVMFWTGLLVTLFEVAGRVLHL